MTQSTICAIRRSGIHSLAHLQETNMGGNWAAWGMTPDWTVIHFDSPQCSWHSWECQSCCAHPWKTSFVTGEKASLTWTGLNRSALAENHSVTTHPSSLIQWWPSVCTRVNVNVLSWRTGWFPCLFWYGCKQTRKKDHKMQIIKSNM